MTNWKTTVSGILTILGGIAAGGKLVLAGQVAEGVGIIITAVTAGIGLIVAKDSNVTGGTIKQ